MPAPTKQERLEQVGKIRQGFTFNDETPVFGNVQSADNNDVVCINGSNAAKDSQPASPYQHDNSNNTVMDKIHRFFNKLKDKIAGPEENIKTNYTTREAADIIFSLIASKIVQGKNFKKKEVPMEFEISSNNVSTQYSQGNAFSKLKELIKKATEARKSGVTKGVFIVGHNFILSGEETAQKMSNLLINARNNGVPVLLSYDQFGTHIYASGALPVIDRMRKAGIGILTNASLMGDRMDHRKIYFIGTGDGHVACLAGGQGWCVQYSGKDWDNLPALTDEEGGAAQNGSGDETWMDHMRMVDGEAALQGSLHFIGCFTSQADIEVVIKGLALERLAKPQMKRYALVKEALENIFMPKLVQAGNQQAVILTNMTWSKRPITDVWYGCLSDPDVKEIRICMPYITDPVFRAKLKQAVKDGKDVRILIPGISDNFLSQMATKYHFHDLVQIHSELVEKSKNAGTLDLRTYQSKDGDPMMLHMKFGIFIHKVNNKEDTVIDGSYNATALEARAGERNADIMLKGKEPALKAADEFDELFKMAKKYEPSLKDKAGLPVMIILRPFM
jgi:phosphatidylserine/phosphatidylglycerophosphate/cardiolipin synthase-like enzyme